MSKKEKVEINNSNSKVKIRNSISGISSFLPPEPPPIRPPSQKKTKKKK